MLTHFPVALPDEVLYSRLARWHLHSGSRSPKQTLDDLFGNRSVRAAIDLQRHLRALSERISELTPCSPQDLLRQTLFGYYASHQTAGMARMAMGAMIDGQASGLHARLGIAAGTRLPPCPLRWCPRCHAAAMRQHSESFWRRAHQLPGVLVCPSHGLPLRNARLPEAVGQHEFIAATFRTCPPEDPSLPDWAESPETIQLLWDIAQKSARLLDHPAPAPSLSALTDQCRDRLITADLALPSGRLRISRLNFFNLQKTFSMRWHQT
ncbi:TniQ family protein [Paenirhodobacter sp.]|uniref:TniQ family protein n=1 Tax=Paenirhodobacter sp. TaxID=1965326 RepID=UPI003B40F213